MPPLDAIQYLAAYSIPVTITPGISGINYQLVNPAGSGVLVRVREYLLVAAAAVTLTLKRYGTANIGGTAGTTPTLTALNSLDAGNQHTTATYYTAAPSGGTVGTGGVLRQTPLQAGQALSESPDKVQLPYMTLHPGEALTIELSSAVALTGWIEITEEPGS